MVFKREVEGDVKALKDAKIVAFSCPLDSMATETKASYHWQWKKTKFMSQSQRLEMISCQPGREIRKLKYSWEQNWISLDLDLT